jgi:hypothetical protein
MNANFTRWVLEVANQEYKGDLTLLSLELELI